MVNMNHTLNTFYLNVQKDIYCQYCQLVKKNIKVYVEKQTILNNQYDLWYTSDFISYHRIYKFVTTLNYMKTPIYTSCFVNA